MKKHENNQENTDPISKKMTTQNAHEMITSIWSDQKEYPRTHHLTRDDIVQTAIQIADTDGIDAVSMRKIASKLGVHATSLYWYVKTKDDLLDIMLDNLMGEQLIDGVPSGDWKGDMRTIARATYERLRRHPWVARELGRRRVLVGPRTLGHIEQSLAAIACLHLDSPTSLAVINSIDSYVIGYALRDIAGKEAEKRSGIDDDEWMEAVAPYVEKTLATGAYPHFRKFVENPFDLHDHQQFDFGLDCLISGIDARVSSEKGHDQE